MHVPAQDYVEIRSVVDAYHCLLDLRRFADVADCFTPDARLIYLDGRVDITGREEIRDFFGNRSGPRAQGIESNRVSTHTVMNLMITLESPDAATCISHSFVSHVGTRGGREIFVRRHVRYTDDFTRVSGEWLIARRVHEGLFEQSTGADPE